MDDSNPVPKKIDPQKPVYCRLSTGCSVRGEKNINTCFTRTILDFDVFLTGKIVRLHLTDLGHAPKDISQV